MGKQEVALGGDTFAFFTRNPRGGSAKEIKGEDVQRLLTLMKDHSFGPLVAHAPYTMNVCAAKEDIRKFSVEMLKDDIRRMEYLPGAFYNFHPGSHVGQGSEAGIELIAAALNECISSTQSVTILLETMAGKGSEVGRSFEELKEIMDRVSCKEKLVEEPHHIEFQILGDNHGNVIHLFDRECSVQRRNQKIVEESPSPFLTPELRQEMGEKAVAAARAVNYSGAGTIEFLVDKNRDFYFLEMNTRLQVEHPITEEVVGVDLVKEQIRIANNEVLHLKQEELFQRGHAIECRICAEDTENNFMPSPGIIKQLTEPNGIGVRIDSYVYEGYEIPIYYDPMIGKLIVWATTRQYAIERMRRVLYEYKITGLKTNLSYLKRIMHTPDFVKGEYNTLFIEKNSRMLLRGNGNNEEIENITMIASYIDYLMNLEENKSPQLSDARPISRWREFGLQKGVLRI